MYLWLAYRKWYYCFGQWWTAWCGKYWLVTKRVSCWPSRADVCWPISAAVTALHVEHEDDVCHGAGCNYPRDPCCAGCQSLPVRAVRAVPVDLFVRWRVFRLVGSVGNGGLQITTAIAQWRSLQAYLRHINRLQKHSIKDCQRAEIVRLSPVPHVLVAI